MQNWHQKKAQIGVGRIYVLSWNSDLDLKQINT